MASTKCERNPEAVSSDERNTSIVIYGERGDRHATKKRSDFHGGGKRRAMASVQGRRVNQRDRASARAWWPRDFRRAQAYGWHRASGAAPLLAGAEPD